MKTNEIVKINNKEVHFEREDNQIFCTSLDIARVFEKRHSHILESIDNVIKNLREIGYLECVPNFRESYEERKIGGFKGVAKYRYYQLNRDAFTLIAMGLTGKKALKWKCDFLNAFNEMEQALLKAQTIANEVYNLHYKTHCRDIVLQRVKAMEKDKKSKCISINSYSVVETMTNDKIHTKIEVTAEFSTLPKHSQRSLK